MKSQSILFSVLALQRLIFEEYRLPSKYEEENVGEKELAEVLREFFPRENKHLITKLVLLLMSIIINPSVVGQHQTLIVG